MALWDKVGCPVKLVTLCEGVATIPHSRYPVHATKSYRQTTTYRFLHVLCHLYNTGVFLQYSSRATTHSKKRCKVQSRIQLQLHYTCCVRVTYAEYVLHKLCMCYKCCVCYISCICVMHAAYVLHKLCMRYACCCTANAVSEELSTTSTKCQDKM